MLYFSKRYRFLEVMVNTGFFGKKCLPKRRSIAFLCCLCVIEEVFSINVQVFLFIVMNFRISSEILDLAYENVVTKSYQAK